MGAGLSDLKDIEDSVAKILQDQHEAMHEYEVQKERESEYQKDLGDLSTQLEKKENELKILKKEMETIKKSVKDTADSLHDEMKQNIAALRNQIKLYTESHHGSQSGNQVNIGIFGNTGVGKTSLINSLKFSVHGKLEEIMKEQVAPENHFGAHTLLRLAVGITPLVTIIDNRGVGPEDLAKDGAIEELNRQLRGKASFTQPVDWKTPNQKSTHPDARKKISCSILVINALNLESIGEHGERFLKCLVEWHGQYPIAVLTHVDVATSDQLRKMRRVIKEIGITEVYEVANVTINRPELEMEYQSCLLRMLAKCVTNSEYTAKYHKNKPIE